MTTTCENVNAATPRVVVADKAGACFGVERALKLALETGRAAEGPVHTLGPLIHNPVVVRELESSGVTVVASTDEVGEGATLLLRTHGVTPAVEEAARAAGATVLDATCPFVKKCHRAAERLVAEGYQLIIVGEDGHPEVEGTLGHAPGALVIGTPKEAAAAELKRKVGIVVQTTQAEDNLRAIVSALLGRCEELRVIDTICEATHERQDAASALAGQADVMVVIGGRNSANTRHLAEICAEHCARTHHIETADELEPAWFAGAALIGVTAGASTPQAHIDSVVAAIERLDAASGAATPAEAEA